MKLAIYQPYLKGRGGIEKLVLEYARNSSHEVTVFTLFHDSEATFESYSEVKVEVLGSNRPPSNFFDKGLRFGLGAVLRKLPVKDFDALIVSEAGLGSLGAIRNSDIPTLAYVHTPLRPALPEFAQRYRSEKHPAALPVWDAGIRMYNFLERTAWSNFDRVVANSRLTRSRIAAKGLRQESEVEVVNPGADTVEETGELGDYFLYPSRFRRYKRQELAIEAWRKAETGDFSLVLAGAAQEADYLEELREMADSSIEFRLDLPEDEWMETYRNAYAVLFLAEKEDWGIVPVEAGMHGKPTVAVREGSPAGTVDHGETGFLVEADAEEIADRIEDLIALREEAERMGANAREKALEYSWERFAEKLDREIEATVEES